MEGWIKLHRKILECDFWLSDEKYDCRSAWIDLLLLANHRDRQMLFDGNLIEVKRGQYITSVRKLGERWHWGNAKTLKYLRTLEMLGMITKKSNSSRTLLTIVNYEVYQGDENAEGNAYRTLAERSSTTNKNIKNEKNVKNIYGEYKHVRLTTSEFEKLNADYGETRTQEAITYLDEYIEMKGYKAKSHNLAIRKWVFDAVDRTKTKTSTKKNQFTSMSQTQDYDVDALERELLAN